MRSTWRKEEIGSKSGVMWPHAAGGLAKWICEANDTTSMNGI